VTTPPESPWKYRLGFALGRYGAPLVFGVLLGLVSVGLIVAGYHHLEAP